MRDDDVIDIDAGPRVKKMTRLAVEWIAQKEGVPMMRVWQRGIEAMMADYDWTREELADYYGRRAVDLDTAMNQMKESGIRTRRTMNGFGKRDRKAA